MILLSCASLRRYYPVQVVRVRSEALMAALQSQRCAPLAEYNIYLFTIVLYRNSVKRLLSECPGEFIKKFSTPATLRFPNRAHRYPLQRQ